jgi:hypothetical protein
MQLCDQTWHLPTAACREALATTQAKAVDAKQSKPQVRLACCPHSLDLQGAGSHPLRGCHFTMDGCG